MKWIVSDSQQSENQNIRVKIPNALSVQVPFEAQVNDTSLQCWWEPQTKLLKIIDKRGVQQQASIRNYELTKRPDGDYEVKIEFKSPFSNEIKVMATRVSLDTPAREQRKKLVQKQGFQLKSPMNGKVLSIAVNVGDHVQVGQKLLIVEAMKMENSILAETEGVIESIHTEAGAVISAGTLLIKAKSPS